MPSNPWSAVTSVGVLHWYPAAPYVDSFPIELADNVVTILGQLDSIRLTPTSTPVPAEVDNPEAVLAALRVVMPAAGWIRTTGDAPHLAEVPPDAIA